MLITIVAFLAVLLVLVLVHEIGHFSMAKLFHVRVEEFGVGFPPRLISFKRGETRYSVNALPLGGFVKMAGEEDPKVTGSLASKSAVIRITVLAMGALMNALLPVVLFSIAFMIPQNTTKARVLVNSVEPNSPAFQAGIQPGDTVISIKGREIRNRGDLRRAVQLNLGQSISIEVIHTDNTKATVRLIPRWRSEGAIGLWMIDVDPVEVSETRPVWEAVPMSVGESIDAYVLFKNSIILMFVGTAPAGVAGPVGIAQITGEVARAGISPLLQFAAFLSINLAIVNILPLPALDGGRIAFVLVEKIRRGKRISPRVEALVHAVGFAMLMALILLVTYRDILRIVSGESLIP